MIFEISNAAVGTGVAASFITCALIVATKRLHGRLTLDSASGIQKVHEVPTPRVGGLAILLGILVAYASVPADTAALIAPMLLASVPCFVFGLAEDITKRVGVRERLLAAFASGLLIWWLTGESLDRLDIWGVDHVLDWLPASVLVTAFALAGMANAANIIDGFNGLASGVLLVCLAAFAGLAFLVGDAPLAEVCLVLGSVVLGFLLVNFPLGKIFLGDGGAYVLGFWVGWVAVLLPMRNADVSPWASLMIVAYPVLEVLFSITRRAATRTSPGAADDRHLHSLLGRWLAARGARWPHYLRNAAVAPFGWVFAAMPAIFGVLLWHDTSALMLMFTAATALYGITYLGLTRVAVRRVPVGASEVGTIRADADAASPSAITSARKLLFINRFFYPDNSATSQILGDLAFHLAKEGEQVYVITSRLQHDSAARLPSRGMERGVHVLRLWSCQFGRRSLLGRMLDYLAFYAGAARAVWKMADANTVVIAKTDPPLLSLVAAPIARLRGARYINWLQDVFPEVAGALGVGRLPAPVMGMLLAARNRTLRGADANVVLGLRMQSLVAMQPGVRAERVHVIHNWADGESISPVGALVNPLRQAWGLDGKFVVGYSGNLGRAHEFQTILGAAELLKDRPDIVFLFIGGGVNRQLLEQEVRLRSSQNIRFFPYQKREQLSQSLSAADVHLVSLNPALEGLIVPSKFYGVAAAGRPSIFIGDTDGEIPRILREAECGYDVAIGDSQRLASVLRGMADAPAVCEEMGARARRLLEDRFDVGIAMAAWKKVLTPA